MNGERVRCSWAKSDLAIAYHDDEWGVRTHDDRKLFEMLSLEGAQAGLSWETILRKRAAYRKAFADFDVQRVAKFTPARIERLLTDPGIVRNRQKVASVVQNARAWIKIQRQFGSFDAYLQRSGGDEAEPEPPLARARLFVRRADDLSRFPASRRHRQRSRGSMLQAPEVAPASSYEQAVPRMRALQADDDERVLPQARTAFFDCGKRTPLAVVLLHGLTNHPGQYRAFAPLLFERGVNVLVPRLPDQGDRDRMTRRLAGLTAEALLARASQAVDIACGLGDRVCVAGISTSGLLSAYFAQHRPDVARAIAIAPVFSILKLPYAASTLAAHLMLLLPNAFVWWDPRVKEQQRPSTAYPRFPTHALAQCLRIGDDVVFQSGRNPIAARSVIALTNRCDPAVNNRVTDRVVERWQRFAADRVSRIERTDLPANHDIIDPDNPKARTDLVYPQLLELIDAAP